LRSRFGSARKQDRKFLAADPAESIAGTDVIAAATRNRREHPIAGRMAQGVVDRLEVIDGGCGQKLGLG
jgi:hypothetical protein